MKAYQFEEKIMFRSSFVLSIILPIATLGNIIFHLELLTILLTGFSSLFFIALYLVGKKFQKFEQLRFLITLYALVFLNVMFFHNYGSRGPILCNFIAVLCALIFIWDKKKLPILAAIFFLNILLLCFIELNNATITKPYPNEQSRIIDMYLGTLISFFFILGYAFYSKERYTQEYLKKSQSDQYKTAFLISLYGQLKIPLKTIVGFSELLEQTDNVEKRKYYLNTISKNSKQLLLFMNDIFDLSLIESDQLMIDKNIINIKEVISDVLKSIELERENKHVEIVTENLPSKGYIVNTDEFRLKKIIQGVILFAIKQTIKGEIKISFLNKNNYCIVLVSGNGIYFNQNEIDLIFNPNEKIQPVTENLNGIILEFFISRKIMKLLGGELNIESFPGKGTTFYISIPLDLSNGFKVYI